MHSRKLRSCSRNTSGISVGRWANAPHSFSICVDDWKLRRTLTLSLGLRYERQTNIRDQNDFAPRIGIAWAARPKTVVRAGFGIFYDRFALANTMTALRRNGIRQQQYVITNPDFYPFIPPISSLAAFQSAQIREQISPTLGTPTYYQSAISLE